MTGKEFKLDWTVTGNDQFAQVEFLEIEYHFPSDVAGTGAYLKID